MRNLILKDNGDYTLIARVKEDDTVHEYVVAWNFQADGTWGQGHYFSELSDAMMFMETKMSKQEKRAKMLKEMHEYLRTKVDDEEAYMCWIDLVPDEPDDEDFKEIAEDTSQWKACCIMFKALVKNYDL